MAKKKNDGTVKLAVLCTAVPVGVIVVGGTVRKLYAIQHKVKEVVGTAETVVDTAATVAETVETVAPVVQNVAETVQKVQQSPHAGTLTVARQAAGLPNRVKKALAQQRTNVQRNLHRANV